MDRYYRGRCAHGLWFALLTGDAAQDHVVTITCPQGCTVDLESSEVAPPT